MRATAELRVSPRGSPQVLALDTDAADLERELQAQVRALAPTLLTERGVGPTVAAQLLVAWSHRGRLRSEGAFARLAGVAPLEVSSGQTVRHRLNRTGERAVTAPSTWPS
jgi:transposase